MKSIFIVDGSLDRPILHSQGLPLIKRIRKRIDASYILSFEESEYPDNSNLWFDLSNSGIIWLWVKNIKTTNGLQRINQILIGLWAAIKLCRREKIDVVHCRSYRPALIGSILKKILRCGYIFDMRGFLIDEQIMLGRWKPKGLFFLMARFFEKWCILNADIVITNTIAFRNAVINLPYFSAWTSASKVIIIPNCVDTKKFLANHPNRLITRRELNWNDRCVMIFAGEARDWEAFEQIIMLFKTVRSEIPNLYLALICYGDLLGVKQLLVRSNIDKNDYCIRTISPNQMPEILGAADVSVLLRKQDVYTKTVSSPIKFAEYLSSGLPVIMNSGIGDTTGIIEKYKVGAILELAESDQLKPCITELMKMVENDPELRQRCHEAAEKELSLDFSEELYFKAYQSVSKTAQERMNHCNKNG